MKKRLTISFIPIFLLLLTNCSSNKEVSIDYPFLQKKDENITILFSDELFINEEGKYYDALLDINRRYPDKLRSFNIIDSSERVLVTHYEITEFPTLIILHNDDIKIRVAGALKKHEILQALEKELLN
ncbi:hypothetical protein BKP37_12495 [Anaerobacillus alkalilacustris]|uniref:Small peptidoglycan-associated lipoprotein n=2 Tax=Anaerobacillus alkalilacustris TaxID=393763 RepID=A0A1S2LLH3_9BACI|nr:hypothetical protein BKP37_12495 [Anaerobacillus alkalilacustris]